MFRKIIAASAVALALCAAPLMAQTIGPSPPATGSGTVTSVGLIAPSIFTPGAAVTTNGSVSFTLNSQTANKVWAAPSGSAGAPVFRALVPLDIPTLNQNTTGTAANITGVLAVANGGTNSITASGTALDNISGFAGTGIIRRTGAGAYSFGTAVGNSELASMSSGTVKANITGSGATPTDITGNSLYINLLPRSCINIVAYGADPSGASASDAAWSSALASAGGNNICVYFPRGNYSFAGGLSVSMAGGNTAASTMLIGDGPENTKLTFGANVPGISITLNSNLQSAHVANLSVLASNQNNQSGISFVNASGAGNPTSNDITNVVVRGSDGYNVTNYWTNDINIDRVSSVNFTNIMLYGWTNGAPNAIITSPNTCLVLNSTSSVIGIQYNIVNSQIDFCQNGLYYGAYIQGVQISNTNFTGNYRGIYLPSSNVGNDQLAISTSQFNNGGYAIAISANLDGFTLSSSDIYSGVGSGGIGVNINPGGQYTIVGNTFTYIGSGSSQAIIVGPWSLGGGVITGNQFNQAWGTAVNLLAGSKNANVQANSYTGPTLNVINAGTSNSVGVATQ